MATRIIKPTRDDSMLSGFETTPEVAPSSIRKEGTLAAQVFLFVGFFLILVGALAIIAPFAGWGYPIKPGLGYVSLTIGLALMLYHCHVDEEPQFKILYSFLALALIAGAGFTRFLGYNTRSPYYFFGLSVPMLFVALLFIVGILRNPKETPLGVTLRKTLLGVGGILLAYGIVRGYLNVNFITGEGVVCIAFGLMYLGAFLAFDPEAKEQLTYYVAIALAAIGGVNLVVALLRSFIIVNFFAPSGIILVSASVIAIGVATLLICDWPFVVLTRRELTAYFYSPIAYLMQFGVLIMFGLNFWFFAGYINQPNVESTQPVFHYIGTILPIIDLMLIVPVLTMRLFAEEKRTGSLEVLLTAPVDEASVILSKFFASLIFFVVTWAPFFLFMVAFRVFGKAEFDYLPLLAFFGALVSSGAALLALGIFFSSLTSNQIISAVFTFAAVLLLVILTVVPSIVGRGGIMEVAKRYSIMDFWSESSQGRVVVRVYVLYLTSAAYFLFLTYLVLTSRKWK